MTKIYQRMTCRSTKSSRSRPPRRTYKPSSPTLFGMETMDRFLHSSYDKFTGRVTITNFLPLLAERVAANGCALWPRSRDVVRTAPQSCWFLCTHNAGDPKWI
jgi:arsenate reductase